VTPPILISTGEVSGDVVAGLVAQDIRRRAPDCRMYGLGGDHMTDAGVELVARTTHLGAVGLTEGVAVAPALLRCWRQLQARVRRDPPSVALLIENDFFHMIVARRLRRLGIPTVTFFPPQIWIWRPVARTIARSYDLILASFPEEETVYRSAGADVVFVGHYLVDCLSPVTAAERVAARATLHVQGDGPIVALLPGSRRQEVRRIAPVFLETAARLIDRDANLRFVLPVADARFRSLLERDIRARHLERLIALCDQSVPAMRAADLLLVASGTATLEGMLLRVPMVIGYKMSALSYAVLRACRRFGAIRESFMGMPNLVLGRQFVPELLQDSLTAEALTGEAWTLLTSTDRRLTQQAAHAEAAALLAGGGSLGRVAEAVLAMAERRR
jgi:lipid-A-disaccharide synthase